MKRAIATLITFTGSALTAAGIAMIYEPAGIIAAGVALLGVGLYGIDVEEGK